MKIINQSLRVQGVTFATKDPEKLAAFYQQALNIPVAQKIDKDHMGVQLENMYLGFDRIGESAKPTPNGPVVWFWVENVEETYLQLVEMQAQVRTEVNRDQRPGYALAVFFDPDGNMFGIMGPSVPGGAAPTD
jgi:catechol 2,3-dioxygenase-like lactoylglutathione lyase family enzyme